MADEIKNETTVHEEVNSTSKETEVKTPIDVTIDEKTQSGIIYAIKSFFNKFVSGNSTYKLVFFSVLILIVLCAAVLAYFGYITPETFKGVLDTFLNLFSEPENSVETVSYLSNVSYFG